MLFLFVVEEAVDVELDEEDCAEDCAAPVAVFTFVAVESLLAVAALDDSVVVDDEAVAAASAADLAFFVSSGRAAQVIVEQISRATNNVHIRETGTLIKSSQVSA